MSEATACGGAWHREWRWVVPLMVAVAGLFGWRVLVDFGNWGVQDWDASAFFIESARIAITQYGQFPLWNPWFCGGAPMLARPEASCISPAFFVPLLLGSFTGIRLLILAYLAVGLVGAFRLGRYFGLGAVAAVLAAIILMCGGAFTAHLTVGNIWVLPVGLIPWALLFLLSALMRKVSASGGGGEVFASEAPTGGGNNRGGGRGEDFASEAPTGEEKTGGRRLGGAVGGALILALIWLGGAPYLLVMTVIWIGLYAGVGVLRHTVRWRDAAQVLGVAGVVAFGLCAIQLIPCLEFTLQYPRVQNPYAGFSVESLIFGLVSRDQSLHAVDAVAKINGFWRGVSHGMNETGTYVGVVPLALCVVGMVAQGRRRLGLLICTLVCVWLSFGPRAAPLSLWNFLHELPVFNIMRVPERFRLLFLPGLAIFAGFGLEALAAAAGRWWGRRKGGGGEAEEGEGEGKVSASGAPTSGAPTSGRKVGRVVAAVVVVCVGVDLMLVVAPLYRQAFTIRPMTIPAAAGGAFVQTAMFYPMASGRWAREGDDTLECAWSSHYPALLANQGIVEGYDEIPMPRMAVPIEDRQGYRGEVFLFQTQGTARYKRWSPNVLTLVVEAVGEGFVVVNQNFMTGWRVRGGGKVVQSVGGLLGVKVGPGDREVEFYYRPASFVIGAWVSGLTVCSLAGWGIRRWRAGKLGVV